MVASQLKCCCATLLLQSYAGPNGGAVAVAPLSRYKAMNGKHKVETVLRYLDYFLIHSAVKLNSFKMLSVLIFQRNKLQRAKITRLIL